MNKNSGKLKASCHNPPNCPFVHNWAKFRRVHEHSNPCSPVYKACQIIQSRNVITSISTCFALPGIPCKDLFFWHMTDQNQIVINLIKILANFDRWCQLMANIPNINKPHLPMSVLLKLCIPNIEIITSDIKNPGYLFSSSTGFWVFLKSSGGTIFFTVLGIFWNIWAKIFNFWIFKKLQDILIS